MKYKVEALTQHEFDIVVDMLRSRAGSGSDARNGKGFSVEHYTDTDIGKTDANSALQKFLAAERTALAGP